MDRSERLNKLGDSWFSSKAIEVVPDKISGRGRALFGLGALPGYRRQANSEDHFVPAGESVCGG